MDSKPAVSSDEVLEDDVFEAVPLARQTALDRRGEDAVDRVRQDPTLDGQVGGWWRAGQ